MDTCRKCHREIGTTERKWFNPEDPIDLWVCEECHEKGTPDPLKVLVDAQQKRARGECIHWHIRRTAVGNYYCSDCGREAFVNVSPETGERTKEV